MFTSENNPGRNDKRANEAVELYISGMSLAKVAKVMGCSRQAVHDMCRLRPEYKPRKAKPSECQYFNGVKYTKRVTGYFLSTNGDRTLMHRDVWQYNNGPIPDDFDIHHKDHDKSNNGIENLEMLSKSEHARMYSTGKNQFTKRITA
ncbi:hypothetical protein AGMMS50268_03770 [Spirochaetia bacterium]|nr:hypothetical protein AGMMS50268_03770 [Spirochaetia bacterium]